MTEKTFLSIRKNKQRMQHDKIRKQFSQLLEKEGQICKFTSSQIQELNFELITPNLPLQRRLQLVKSIIQQEKYFDLYPLRRSILLQYIRTHCFILDPRQYTYLKSYLKQNQYIVNFVKSGLFTDVKVQNFESLEILLKIRKIASNDYFVSMMDDEQDVQALFRLAKHTNFMIKKKALYLLNVFARSSPQATKYVYTNQSVVSEIISIIVSNQIDDEQLNVIALHCCKLLVRTIEFSEENPKGAEQEQDNKSNQLYISYQFVLSLFNQMKKKSQFPYARNFYSIQCINQFVRYNQRRLKYVLQLDEFKLVMNCLNLKEPKATQIQIIEILIHVSCLDDQFIEMLLCGTDKLDIIFQLAIDQEECHNLIQRASYFLSNICASSEMFKTELLKKDKFQKIIEKYSKLNQPLLLMNFLMIIGNIFDRNDNIDHLYELFPAILNISCLKSGEVLNYLNFSQQKSWDNERFVSGNLINIKYVLKQVANPLTDYHLIQEYMAEIAAKCQYQDIRSTAVQISMIYLNSRAGEGDDGLGGGESGYKDKNLNF